MRQRPSRPLPDPAPGLQSESFGLVLTVPGQPEYLGVVRLAIAGLCHRLGLDPGEAEDLKLAVAEACSQVIQGRPVPDRICLAVSVEEDRIQVDLVPHPTVDSLFAPEGPAALGLLLIEALVDRMEQLQSPCGLRLTRLLPKESP